MLVVGSMRAPDEGVGAMLSLVSYRELAGEVNNQLCSPAMLPFLVLRGSVIRGDLCSISDFKMAGVGTWLRLLHLITMVPTFKYGL